MKKNYKDGVYEGEGTLFTKKRHGKGKMTYTNGDVYEGEWKDDKRCGEGELRRNLGVLGTRTYKGIWFNDKLNGQGSYTDKSLVYEGEFKDGEYSGQGTLTTKRNGIVICTYTGHFLHGKKSGQGTEKCKEYTYKGAFINDRMDGKGRQDFPNKDYFDGHFICGKFVRGVAKKTEETGDVYTGGYERGTYEGQGELKMTDGTRYKGTFKNGQLNGVITVTKPDGTKTKETYENGAVVSDVQKKAATSKSTKADEEKKATKKTTQEKKSSAKSAKKSEEEKADKAKSSKKAAAKVTDSSDNSADDSAPEAETKKPRTSKAKSPLFTSEMERLKIKISKLKSAVKKSVEKAEQACKDAQELTGKIRINCLHKAPKTFLNEESGKDDTYYGELSFNGKADGEGIYIWESGDKYYGEHLFGLRSGLGYYEFSNGDKYWGKWWNNDRHDCGVLSSKKGMKYIGDLVKNEYEGYGKLILENGDIYEGHFKNSENDGYGTYVWNKDSEWLGDKYEGEWANGKRTGFGAYYCSNGDILIGTWDKGKANGKMALSFRNGDWFEGEYINDKMNGYGVYHWKDGTKYEGDWVDDLRTGNGTYYFADGFIYTGAFLNDRFHGKGTLTFANGDTSEGNFDNGNAIGSFLYTHTDGTQETGTYVNGSFMPDNDDADPQNNNHNQNSNNNSNNANSEKSESSEKKMFTPVTGGGITFNDVAGLSEVKDEIINHVIEPLRNPELASIFGVKPGGKILLYGPPGTGKTYIARAIAGEIDAAFYSVSCQDLISKWLGESSERISRLFDEAQEHDKAIIFFDEFDSVAAKRDSEFDSPAMARFLATFLTKVDGFKPIENKMLLLIAATNRPWALDSAILRGGRFDKQIYISLPDKEARQFLVNKSLGALPLDESLNLSALADSLEGFGGSDIVSICEKIRYEAYKKSIKSKQVEKVTLEDCNNAMKGVQNHISQAELDRFEEYRRGLIKQ